MRKVRLPEGSPYGGLLTQAALLKHTSNGTTTSPVTRGAWVMAKLFWNPDLRLARLQAGVARANRDNAGLWQDI